MFVYCNLHVFRFAARSLVSNMNLILILLLIMITCTSTYGDHSWPWDWKTFCPLRSKCKCLITLNEIKLRLDVLGTDLPSLVNNTFGYLSSEAAAADSQTQFRRVLDEIWQLHGFSNRCQVVSKLPCDAVQYLNDTFIKRDRDELRINEKPSFLCKDYLNRIHSTDVQFDD